ncbi:MAG: tetratricopeptide repeat protein [Xenococcaceae cyanobacterium MO_188.B32]|nr:tetratricopeptide repeat protein [Xenococcaceae cyanobacterium MO_188.B32]
MGIAHYQLPLRKTEKGFLIEEEIKKIKLEPVSEEVQALLLADYYLEQQDELKSGFLLAASFPLEKLVQQGDLTSFVHRLLGDIYLRLGRLQEAQEKYEKTLSLAESEPNWEEIAKAQSGLAHVAVINGNFSEAKELLLEAKKVFLLSKNDSQVNLIQGWLVKLEEKMNNKKGKNQKNVAK